MKSLNYRPIFETIRGEIVESVHYGAFAIVDSIGNLIAFHGDPNIITYLRSSAKPFQAIPFVESGGVEKFDISAGELAIICASHSGTDKHVNTVASIQQKIHSSESDLMCGVHPPYDKSTANEIRIRQEEPTPNRHNCSGKHTGMLAFAIMNGWTISDYINQNHPVQKRILECFAEMCNLSIGDICVGIDGCSVPNFAVPLYNAALAFARLCDPASLDSGRAAACRTITDAMTSFPEMVSGKDRFDTCLMEIGQGRIVSKGGAEGYQGIGIMPGTLNEASPGLGIAIKISDGDLRDRVRPAVSVKILHNLGALDDTDLEALDTFKPRTHLKNWRGVVVGHSQPNFKLHILE